MNRHEKPSERKLRRDGRWPALLRLEQAIACNTEENCCAGKIRLLREAYFADVDEFERNEPIILPP